MLAFITICRSCFHDQQGSHITKVPNQKITKWTRRASSIFCDSFTLAFSQNSNISVVISTQPHHNIDILYVTKH